MLNYNLVLKSGELFTAGDIETDGSRECATGLYYRDTRHLSTFEVTIDGIAPEVLSINAYNPSHATVICTNRLIERESGDVFPQKLLIVQNVSLGDALEVELSIQNFDQRLLEFKLNALLAADFRDLFDIRGFHRDQRGRWTRPKAGARGIELGYVGLDGKRTCTQVDYDQDCTVSPSISAAEVRDGSFLYLMNTGHGHMVHEIHEVPAANLRFDLDLQPHERWTVRFVVTPQTASVWPVLPDGAGPRVTQTTSDNSVFNEVLTQCRLDLDSLQTTFPHGSLPAAGIPWFVAPFGRDSLITSLQTLHIAPDRAVETVRTLAALQGTRIDPARDEQPGKILHEMRYGEMARIGEVPHSPYYGSVDATPLWLWVLAECVIWTGRTALLDELLPNIQAAIDWIDRYGDIDGDGLVEYRTDSEGVGHITHQVWKDSFDSLNHTDGTPAHGPVAAVEVQGYLYAAYDRLAWVCADHAELAADLRRRAERMRSLIEEQFWLESEGTYAQALDGQKCAVETPSSNPGHLLACGLPTHERAARMADRFEQADFNSGWGIRTLSARAASYNPMSYHNGSIWPHDNSLIGYGLYRYGESATGHLVSTSLYDAAVTKPMHRLPELFCGFPRVGIALDAPIDYPVSCSPQAWAAGALPYLVRGMLGLEVDPETRELRVDPAFPVWINSVTIHRLCVLGQEGTLSACRTGETYEVEASGLHVVRVE